MAFAVMFASRYAYLINVLITMTIQYYFAVMLEINDHQSTMKCS